MKKIFSYFKSRIIDGEKVWKKASILKNENIKKVKRMDYRRVEKVSSFIKLEKVFSEDLNDNKIKPK